MLRKTITGDKKEELGKFQNIQAYEKIKKDFFELGSSKIRMIPVENQFSVMAKLYGANLMVDRKSLQQDLNESLKKIKDQCSEGLPDQFFNDLVNLFKTGLEFSHEENGKGPFFVPKISLLYSQISTVLRDPDLMKDLRILQLIKTISEEKTEFKPYWFQFYVDWVEGEPGKYNGSYVLKKGYDAEHIPIIRSIVSDTSFWRSPVSEFKRVFLENIAELTNHLSKKYPSETLPIRLKLLENYVYFCYEDGFSLRNLVYTFQASEDVEALKKIIDEKPKSEIGELAKKILSGFFENAVWG